MASDYHAIRKDNEQRYGTDIGRIGPMLLSDRYDERTHFIFELLQNAEDALARHAKGVVSREVVFEMVGRELRVRHFGRPFDEQDVRGICGIGESTKNLTSIGRFGIGFKSVYAFTDRPEIHSGGEDFAIESYVWPIAAAPIVRRHDETVISLPLRADEAAMGEITAALDNIPPTTLLFLKNIGRIGWTRDSRTRSWFRKAVELGRDVRRVTVVGHESNKKDLRQSWLLFSRRVTSPGGRYAGTVEIAFSLRKDKRTGRLAIHPLQSSPLAAFFPTVVETHLGFLVQGPYRTTPSRDNVPRTDAWNRYLIHETGALTVRALSWLRDRNMVDVGMLQCLPMERSKFADTMFGEMFDSLKAAFNAHRLLPRLSSGYVKAGNAVLGRTQELKEVFGPQQLSKLLGRSDGVYWLSSEITPDRTPELRRYLIQELEVGDITAELLVAKLDRSFLEAQSDAWIRLLYEFLNLQRALSWRLTDIPIVRLENGSHVVALRDSEPQAFLPSELLTDFPTVRKSICSKSAREFLKSMGLTEPDPVDDIVQNVLPKYTKPEVDVSRATYAADIQRIQTAFATDVKSRREKLLDALRQTTFVMAVDAGDASESVATPGDVYLATELLKRLFSGVDGVLLLDDSYDCLLGGEVGELLEACGVSQCLEGTDWEGEMPWDERQAIRRLAGLERASWAHKPADITLRGLDSVLDLLVHLDPEARKARAAVLWAALCELANQKGSVAFTGRYTWGYSRETKTALFDAAFVRRLNEAAWVPDESGELRRPEVLLFASLGWETNDTLLSKVRFQQPVAVQLASELGIDLRVLDLLKRLRITNEADLLQRLGMNGAASDEAASGPAAQQEGDDDVSSGDELYEASLRTSQAFEDGLSDDAKPKSSRPSETARQFVSYVATQLEEHPDGDGLEVHARADLEEKAIALICSREPVWERAPPSNAGYDLFKTSADEETVCWCEVKAMTGSLDDRPVGLSRAQFQCAIDHSDDYWLYIVEHAGTERARIARIQNPAGRARTFTFDRGWLSIAVLDDEHEAS